MPEPTLRFCAPILRAELPCPILFAGVSGAHLNGFPSPDSDVELRACHILPVADFLRLDQPRLTLDRDLIAVKSAEHITIPLDVAEHDGTLQRLQEQMAEDFAASPLPETPTNRAALEDFVLRVRLASDATGRA